MCWQNQVVGHLGIVPCFQALLIFHQHAVVQDSLCFHITLICKVSLSPAFEALNLKNVVREL